jgi:hypothetical protein
MSTTEPEYVPQKPARKWVVTSTGHFYQVRLSESADGNEARPPVEAEPPSR